MAERDGIPMTVYTNGGTKTVATGSYGNNHGLAVTIHEEYLGEVPDDEINEELHELKEEAVDQLLASMEEERMGDELKALKSNRNL